MLSLPDVADLAVTGSSHRGALPEMRAMQSELAPRVELIYVALTRPEPPCGVMSRSYWPTVDSEAARKMTGVFDMAF